MELRKEQRYSITVMGRYRRGTGVRFNVILQDLSEFGCKFSDLVGHLSEGDEITIRIGDIGPIVARAKWMAKREVGVQFVQPLHPSVLEHIIAQGGTNEAAA